MQRYIRQQVSLVAQANEHESFQEADDFEIDDPEALPLKSVYEFDELYPEPNFPRETLDGLDTAPSLPGDQGREASEGSAATETAAPSPQTAAQD